MLKNLTYLSMLAGLLVALIGFVARVQDSRIFITSRGWLLLGIYCLILANCFALLAIGEYLEKRG